MKKFATILLASSCLAGVSMLTHAQVDPLLEATSGDDLLSTDLEDLLVLESTSVAKKRQNVDDSAAAVYVITQEEIRNSASSNITDLLRVVPGVEVGQITNGVTAVTIRGFNGRNSGSMLVMVDGRSVYVSTLSGVFWDQLNIPLHDIERIEVVRGPGSTLWGANAVNGVINIITKNSADTLGIRTSARAGLREQLVELSSGSEIGADSTIRINGVYRRDQGLQSLSGDDLGTAANEGAVGARFDWQPTARDAMTLQADYKIGARDTTTFNIDPAQIDPTPIPVLTAVDYNEFSVLGRWRREHSEQLDYSFQAYYTTVSREELGYFDFEWSIADLDFGANWRLNETHDVNFGLSLRAMSDRFVLIDPRVDFLDREGTDYWISGYVQDDITLIAETLRLTIGAKLEYNDFTGVEFQPGVRMFYRPNQDLAIWGAVSRAVRTPSRFERYADFQLAALPPNTGRNPSPLPIFTSFLGKPDAEAENLLAYEAGFRANIAPQWSIDVAGYYNFYDSLAEPTVIAVEPNFIPNVPFPLSLTTTAQFQFRGKAETWGLEALIKGQVAPWWHSQLGYSYFKGRTGTDRLSGERFNGFLPLDGSPEHQATLSNNFQLSTSLALNTQLRFVDELIGGQVPSYFDGDVRLRYEAPNGLELSLVGENLLEPRRFEFLFDTYPAPRSTVPRNVALELRYRF
ncbi:TonB-dependent receptor [Croceicoccus sp. YJ47]|nr:TonB-dependent receptor [Croceicoccus sp. YJ47]QQN74300.1 TonB-dependent receptor [Croceicoccus sp. YJ47]